MSRITLISKVNTIAEEEYILTVFEYGGVYWRREESALEYRPHLDTKDFEEFPYYIGIHTWDGGETELFFLPTSHFKKDFNPEMHKLVSQDELMGDYLIKYKLESFI